MQSLLEVPNRCPLDWTRLSCHSIISSRYSASCTDESTCGFSTESVPTPPYGLHAGRRRKGGFPLCIQRSNNSTSAYLVGQINKWNHHLKEGSLMCSKVSPPSVGTTQNLSQGKPSKTTAPQISHLQNKVLVNNQDLQIFPPQTGSQHRRDFSEHGWTLGDSKLFLLVFLVCLFSFLF